MTPWRVAPVLHGRHVTLRPLDDADRDDLRARFEAIGPLFFTAVPSDATLDGWLAEVAREQSAGRAQVFAVLDADGAVVGTTRFMRMSEPHRRVEIGGTLYHPRVQRTGLNTGAKRLLLGHTFETLGCQCVQLRTDWFNRRSRAAIERLGAKLDGVLRGHRIMADGHIRDTAVYSIIASEWPGVRANLDHLLEREPRP